MSTADDQIRKARALIARQQYGLAEKQLVAFRQRFPGNRRVREVLAEMAQHKRPDNPVYGPLIRAFQQALDDYAQGRFAEVVVRADRMLADFPVDADILNLKGLSQLMQGQLAAGIATFSEAVQYHPDQVLLQLHYGTALLEAGEADAAETALRAAAALNPGMAEAQYTLGKSLEQMERVDEAMAVYREAVALKPDYAEAWNNLGNVLRNTGQFEEAAAAYRRALEANPQLTEALRNLADSHKFSADDPLLDDIRTRLKAPDLAVIDEARLRYALAKAARDLGDSEQFIAELGQANALHKTHHGFDTEAELQIFETIRARFMAPERLPRLPEDDRWRPIFILGMPRSGTTLVEQIVSLHSEVDGLGELEFMHRIVHPDLVAEEPNQRPFEEIRRAYLEAVARRTNSRFFTDKMPLNGRWVGHILTALPEARIIRMKRDAMAVCWSNYRTWFPARGMAFTNTMEDIGRFMHRYEALLDFFEATFPGRIYACDYETLTEDPEAESRRIFDALGLDYQDQVLRIEDNTRAVRTASQAQVRGGIYRGSSSEWKQYEAWLEPMRRALETG